MWASSWMGTDGGPRSVACPGWRATARAAISVREVTRTARRVGVQALTLYAFSSQNWARPADEVAGLMELLREYLESERAEILDNGIRLNAIGEVDKLPRYVREPLEPLREASAHNTGMVLTLALSYGGREETAPRGAQAGRDGGARRAWTRRGSATKDLESRPVDAGAAAAGPGDPHQRRAPHLQLPALADGVRGAVLLRRALAGLPDRGLPALPGALPAAGAALRDDLRAAAAGRAQRAKA